MKYALPKLAAAILISSHALKAQTPQAYEQPPTFRASEILPPDLLKSDLHRIREFSPSDGFMIHFTIDTNYGEIRCHGMNELAERLNEVRAIKVLAETSRSDLFAEGLQKSIEAPIDAVKNIAEDPEEAFRKAPATVGHFFKKVGSSVSHAADKVEDKWQNRDKNPQSNAEIIENSGKGLAKSAKSVAGFDKAKLDCARKLGVDPYSDNALLQAEMEKVTWAFFAGGLPLRLGVSAVSGGASAAMTATKTVGLPEDIYDITPGELLLRDRETMQSMGASDTLIDVVLNNPNLSIAKRHSIIQSLASLPKNGDRVNALGIAANCQSKDQARYLNQVLNKLSSQHKATPYAALTTVVRMPAGVTKQGVVEVVAPVDFIAWTPKIADFARAPKMPQMKYRALIYGKISPIAKAGFEAAGWDVVVRD
ncbi:hypothetical protein [Rubritalea tangerina]|uniref:Uncharacterized protein n=1 Tax=Rubritalea tangerina TaxID=430798 RepID=A0ABW4Z7S1_9BACT